MIPHANPFKKSDLEPTTSDSSATSGRSAANALKTDDSNVDPPTSRSPMKVPPPAPIRRVSAKRTVIVKSPSVGETEGTIAEEPFSSTDTAHTLSDADLNSLDELERQIDTSQSSPPRDRISSEMSRTGLGFVPKSRRPISVPDAISIPKMRFGSISAGSIGAPQINGSSTPLPFGVPLPTPNIVSRDLSALSKENTASGGVTSSGLFSPEEKGRTESALSPKSLEKPKRRPSTSGPILCALGCGTMGRSILSGVLDALEEAGTTMTTTENGGRLLPPSRFIACVRREDAAAKLRSEWGDMVTVVRGPQENASAVHESDYILLGSKPQVAKDILNSPGMQEALKGKVLISILAGTTIRSLQAMCPETKIIRVMPNTPSRIRKGMSVIVSGEGVSDSHLELVSWIFNQVGKTLVMDEKHIDAATAMCGSGPAFMAVILESMTDGGVMMGIPRAQAEELAAQTMLGTACMVQAGQHPALIRNNVATPGGCTIGGLLEMEDGKIRSTMARTIQTATNIAAGLGKNS